MVPFSRRHTSSLGLEATEDMRARQRRAPQKWWMTLGQWLDVLTHCINTEQYQELKAKEWNKGRHKKKKDSIQAGSKKCLQSFNCSYCRSPRHCLPWSKLTFVLGITTTSARQGPKGLPPKGYLWLGWFLASSLRNCLQKSSKNRENWPIHGYPVCGYPLTASKFSRWFLFPSCKQSSLASSYATSTWKDEHRVLKQG